MWLSIHIPILLMGAHCNLFNQEEVLLGFPDEEPERMYTYTFDTEWTGNRKEFPVGVTGSSYSVPAAYSSELSMNQLDGSSAKQFLKTFSGQYTRCYLMDHDEEEAIMRMPTVFFYARFSGKRNSAYVLNFTGNGLLFTRPVSVKHEDERYIFDNGSCYKRPISLVELEVLSNPPDGRSTRVQFAEMVSSGGD
ncbi:MAG TPA: hypothetical protein DEA96_16100 [Leptospiraceae bacterium]|nr:hypothetical protein [Spirochaetaceae bacterium]HBS06492.1 hypothetical protein [Leptospiraceae bacterium]|tara:strand:+ start:86720 stop:87298 length:579 start_codon:yes stop_codon:yes gene_type:complete